MDRILWGMVFVLLDFEWEIGERTIGLIPTWLGYWWLAKGFLELEDTWNGFCKCRIPALCLAVYSAVLYAMDLMILSVRQEFILWILELLAVVAAMGMSRFLIRGIRHLEKYRSGELRGEKLRNLWVYLTVVEILAAMLSWVPLVGTGCAVAAFVMAVCWLMALNDAGKRYREME